MKTKNFILSLCLLMNVGVLCAQTNWCNPTGNLAIYSNYDGGQLNINVDQNIPNLIIAVVSYEAVEITISGAFASNVIAVHYAGYNSSNSNCGSTISQTTINGAPTGASTLIEFAPTATMSDPNGYGSIICAYSCGTGSQGGCNTQAQVEDYFLSNHPNATLLFHQLQYNCWSGSTNLSASGTSTCCPAVIPLGVAVNADDEGCVGSCDGSISTLAAGGTGPYSYQWSNGATSGNLNSLCPGTYTVTVTDNVGDTTSTSATINAATALQSSMSTTADDGTCIGTAVLSVTGGTSPYTYDWSNGGNGLAQSGLCAGTYCATVTDDNGCSNVLCDSVELQASNLVIDLDSTNQQCANSCDGSAQVNVSGGVPPYSFSWSNGATTDTNTGLCPNTYSVLVTDSQGDSAFQSIVVNGPLPIIATTTTSSDNNNSCTGSISLATSGGTAPYTFSWDNGSTTTDISGLCAGTYCVTVTDNNGCTVSVCDTVNNVVAVVITNNLAVKLFPNPTQNTVNVQLDIDENIQWQLVDVMGRTLRTGGIPANTTLHPIDLQALPRGNYILHLQGEERRGIYRIQKY